MKYYIGRVTIAEHETGRDYHSDACIVAEDERQAQALNEDRAALWGGDDGKQDSAGGYLFDADGASFTVAPLWLRAISPATFDEMSKMLPSFGKVEKGSLEVDAEPTETIRTIARRLGDQLTKLKAPVSNAKLLQAVSAAIGETGWGVAKAKAKAKVKGVEASGEWLPKGNEYKGPLRNADDIEFGARVDAVWLTDGDVALAAKLLRTTGESLMRSFKEEGEALVAFCERPPQWLPEHSLSRDFGLKANIGRLFEVEVRHKFPGHTEVVGRHNGYEVITFNDHILGEWHLAGLTVPKGDFWTVQQILACQEEALRRAIEVRFRGTQA